MHFIIFQTHTHPPACTHPYTLECFTSQRLSMWLTATAATNTPMQSHFPINYTQTSLESFSLSLMYTYTYTDSHPPAPPASLMVLLLYTGPLPYLALTHGATTLYFQHPIHIQQPTTSSLFLGHLTPDLLPIN